MIRHRKDLLTTDAVVARYRSRKREAASLRVLPP
jgi:hypothetical protein